MKDGAQVTARTITGQFSSVTGNSSDKLIFGIDYSDGSVNVGVQPSDAGQV